MSEMFEYDVFLSYNSKNKEIVHALAERLKKDGLRVWLDAWVIQPTDWIPLKIRQGLEKSCRLLICMSPAYFNLEWGMLEHQTLLFRDPYNARRRFIPLLIEDCIWPDIIAQFAYIDCRMSSKEAYEKLLDICKGAKSEIGKLIVQGKNADQAQMILEGHTGAVWGVVISSDGEKVISL